MVVFVEAVVVARDGKGQHTIRAVVMVDTVF